MVSLFLLFDFSRAPSDPLEHRLNLIIDGGLLNVRVEARSFCLFLEIVPFVSCGASLYAIDEEVVWQACFWFRKMRTEALRFSIS